MKILGQDVLMRKQEIPLDMLDLFEPAECGECYVCRMVVVFREVRRVLADDATLWLNLGDSYANDGKWGGKTGGKQAYLGDNNRKQVGRGKRITGLKPKDLIGIPWMVAFALRADGWYLRQDIIWSKPNPMPESVTDRCTKAHEYIFMLTKSQKYYFDNEAIKEPCVTNDNTVRDRETTRLNNTPGRKRMGGLTTNNYESRNKRSVWTVTTNPYKGAHFATFPSALIEPCILAGCPVGGTVLDPFFGSGTTGEVSEKLGRKWVGIELNPQYERLAKERIQQTGMML